MKIKLTELRELIGEVIKEEAYPLLSYKAIDRKLEGKDKKTPKKISLTKREMNSLENRWIAEIVDTMDEFYSGQ